MDIETAFDLLSHEARRAVVAVLCGTDSISRRRLTERVAGRLADPGAGLGDRPTDRTDRYRIRIALHHNHLPRLADAGAIEYDDERVLTTSEFEDLVSYVKPVEPNLPTTPAELGERLARFYA